MKLTAEEDLVVRGEKKMFTNCHKPAVWLLWQPIVFSNKNRSVSRQLCVNALVYNNGRSQLVSGIQMGSSKNVQTKK